MSGILTDNLGRSTGLLKAAGGGGKIGQVLTAIKSDVTSDTAASWTDISGMTIAITPAATSSKIWWTFNLAAMAASDYASVKIVYGDDSDLTTQAIGDQVGSNRRRSTGACLFQDQADQTMNTQMSGLDAPNTTDATTYKIQCYTPSGTTYFNRMSSDGDNNTIPTPCSSITVMEVLA